MKKKAIKKGQLIEHQFQSMLIRIWLRFVHLQINQLTENVVYALNDAFKNRHIHYRALFEVKHEMRDIETDIYLYSIRVKC